MPVIREQRGEAQGKFRKGGRDQITQKFEGQKKQSGFSPHLLMGTP